MFPSKSVAFGSKRLENSFECNFKVHRQSSLVPTPNESIEIWIVQPSSNGKYRLNKFCMNIVFRNYLRRHAASTTKQLKHCFAAADGYAKLDVTLQSTCMHRLAAMDSDQACVSYDSDARACPISIHVASTEMFYIMPELVVPSDTQVFNLLSHKLVPFNAIVGQEAATLRVVHRFGEVPAVDTKQTVSTKRLAHSAVATKSRKRLKQGRGSEEQDADENKHGGDDDDDVQEPLSLAAASSNNSRLVDLTRKRDQYLRLANKCDTLLRALRTGSGAGSMHSSGGSSTVYRAAPVSNITRAASPLEYSSSSSSLFAATSSSALSSSSSSSNDKSDNRDTSVATEATAQAAPCCVSCLDATAVVALFPCGHVCFCTECDRESERRGAGNCAACANPFEFKLRLFYVH